MLLVKKLSLALVVLFIGSIFAANTLINPGLTTSDCHCKDAQSSLHKTLSESYNLKTFQKDTLPTYLSLLQTSSNLYDQSCKVISKDKVLLELRSKTSTEALNRLKEEVNNIQHFQTEPEKHLHTQLLQITNGLSKASNSAECQVVHSQIDGAYDYIDTLDKVWVKQYLPQRTERLQSFIQKCSKISTETKKAPTQVYRDQDLITNLAQLTKNTKVTQDDLGYIPDLPDSQTSDIENAYNVKVQYSAQLQYQVAIHSSTLNSLLSQLQDPSLTADQKDLILKQVDAQNLAMDDLGQRFQYEALIASYLNMVLNVEAEIENIYQATVQYVQQINQVGYNSPQTLDLATAIYFNQTTLAAYIKARIELELKIADVYSAMIQSLNNVVYDLELNIVNFSDQNTLTVLNNLLATKYSSLADLQSQYQQELNLIAALQEFQQAIEDNAEAYNDLIESLSGVRYQSESAVELNFETIQTVQEVIETEAYNILAADPVNSVSNEIMHNAVVFPQPDLIQSATTVDQQPTIVPTGTIVADEPIYSVSNEIMQNSYGYPEPDLIQSAAPVDQQPTIVPTGTAVSYTDEPVFSVSNEIMQNSYGYPEPDLIQSAAPVDQQPTIVPTGTAVSYTDEPVYSVPNEIMQNSYGYPEPDLIQSAAPVDQQPTIVPTGTAVSYTDEPVYSVPNEIMQNSYGYPEPDLIQSAAPVDQQPTIVPTGTAVSYTDEPVYSYSNEIMQNAYGVPEPDFTQSAAPVDQYSDIVPTGTVVSPTIGTVAAPSASDTDCTIQVIQPTSTGVVEMVETYVVEIDIVEIIEDGQVQTYYVPHVNPEPEVPFAPYDTPTTSTEYYTYDDQPIPTGDSVVQIPYDDYPIFDPMSEASNGAIYPDTIPIGIDEPVVQTPYPAVPVTEDTPVANDQVYQIVEAYEGEQYYFIVEMVETYDYVEAWEMVEAVETIEMYVEDGNYYYYDDHIDLPVSTPADDQTQVIYPYDEPVATPYGYQDEVIYPYGDPIATPGNQDIPIPAPYPEIPIETVYVDYYEPPTEEIEYQVVDETPETVELVVYPQPEDFYPPYGIDPSQYGENVEVIYQIEYQIIVEMVETPTESYAVAVVEALPNSPYGQYYQDGEAWDIVEVIETVYVDYEVIIETIETVMGESEAVITLVPQSPIPTGDAYTDSGYDIIPTGSGDIIPTGSGDIIPTGSGDVITPTGDNYEVIIVDAVETLVDGEPQTDFYYHPATPEEINQTPADNSTPDILGQASNPFGYSDNYNPDPVQDSTPYGNDANDILGQASNPFDGADNATPINDQVSVIVNNDNPDEVVIQIVENTYQIPTYVDGETEMMVETYFEMVEMVEMVEMIEVVEYDPTTGEIYNTYYEPYPGNTGGIVPTGSTPDSDYYSDIIPTGSNPDDVVQTGYNTGIVPPDYNTGIVPPDYFNDGNVEVEYIIEYIVEVEPIEVIQTVEVIVPNEYYDAMGEIEVEYIYEMVETVETIVEVYVIQGEELVPIQTNLPTSPQLPDEDYPAGNIPIYPGGYDYEPVDDEYTYNDNGDVVAAPQDPYVNSFDPYMNSDSSIIPQDDENGWSILPTGDSPVGVPQEDDEWGVTPVGATNDPYVNSFDPYLGSDTSIIPQGGDDEWSVIPIDDGSLGAPQDPNDWSYIGDESLGGTDNNDVGNIPIYDGSLGGPQDNTNWDYIPDDEVVGVPQDNTPVVGAPISDETTVGGGTGGFLDVPPTCVSKSIHTQSGHFSFSDQSTCDFSGQQTVEIDFDTPFDSAPDVAVFVSGFDLEFPYSTNVQATVLESSATSFTLQFNCDVAGLELNWVATVSDFSGINVFSHTVEIDANDPANQVNSNSLRFTINHETDLQIPSAFVGLSGWEFYDTNVAPSLFASVDNVNSNGYDLVVSWENSRLKSVKVDVLHFEEDSTTHTSLEARSLPVFAMDLDARYQDAHIFVGGIAGFKPKLGLSEYVLMPQYSLDGNTVVVDYGSGLDYTQIASNIFITDNIRGQVLPL